MEKLKKLPLSTHFAIYAICLAVGVIIVMVSNKFSTDGSVNAAMVFASAVMLAGFVWHSIFLRCPHCDAHFHFKALLPKICPDCGKEVDTRGNRG